jgi:tetratricopeptide (TPR) repeat protein
VDREFAFGLVPAEDLTAKTAKDAKENQKADLALPKYEDLFKPSRSLRASRFDAFSQHDLTTRAADYFAQARKPRAEWKRLEDLQAQQDEFDLRCAAGDYDTAADVLTDIDFDYLLLWGQYRLMIQMHERVTEKIQDANLKMGNLNGLGLAYQQLGDARKSILYFERGIPVAQEAKSRGWEGAFLGNLGLAYAALGDARKAIEFHEQALVISREIGDRRSESIDLENTGHAWLSISEYQNAKESYQQAIQIADEISFPQTQSWARWGLAQAYLFVETSEVSKDFGSLTAARATIEAALEYDVPQNNHNTSALHGIILLRMRDASAGSAQRLTGSDENLSGLAVQAFVRAIGQADEILSKTAEYYEALDAKGLALCGLALCARDNGPSTVDGGRGAVPAPDANHTSNTGRGDPGQGNPAPTVDDAIETFRKARKIAPHAGVVKSVLRLFDELAKCDGEGVLKGVREAIVATPLVE